MDSDNFLAVGVREHVFTRKILVRRVDRITAGGVHFFVFLTSMSLVNTKTTITDNTLHRAHPFTAIFLSSLPPEVWIDEAEPCLCNNTR